MPALITSILRVSRTLHVNLVKIWPGRKFPALSNSLQTFSFIANKVGKLFHSGGREGHFLLNIREEPLLLLNIREEPVLLLNIRKMPVLLLNIWEEPVLLLNTRKEPVLLLNIREEPVLLLNIRKEPVLLLNIREEPVFLLNITVERSLIEFYTNDVIKCSANLDHHGLWHGEGVQLEGAEGAPPLRVLGSGQDRCRYVVLCATTTSSGSWPGLL